MYKKCILFTILLIITFSTTYSQDDDFFKEGVDINIDEVLNGYVARVNPILYSNLLFLHQAGTENKIVSNQEQQGNLQNKIITIQNGTLNSVFSDQKGTHLYSEIEQYKAYNEAILGLQGANIKVKLIQDGISNKLNSFIENYNELIHYAEFLQKGNNNFINVALRGDNFQSIDDQWIKIKQFGNSHQAEAIIDPFSTPIEIIQTSSPGGEGMKVNVSTSAFYFPMK